MRRAPVIMETLRPLPLTSPTARSSLPSERDDVDVVATDFVAGGGADGEGVAGEVGEGLGEEAALDGAGGVEIELDALPFEGTFVMLGVADGEGGLEGEAFEEVAFFEGEGLRAVDDDVGEDVAAFAGAGGRRSRGDRTSGAGLRGACRTG